MIHALVLAAGESKRMGMPKPLLCFEATTFLEHIVAVLQRSHVDRITVILGSQARAIRASTDLSTVQVVVNQDYHQGQLSSLAVGLRSVPADTEAVVLCLVDNPFITAEVVDRLIGAFRETGQPIVVPVMAGQRGHPTLFARLVFDELLTAPSDQGARHVVRSARDRVFEVQMCEPAILTKIDTPDDYRLHFGVTPTIIEGST